MSREEDNPITMKISRKKVRTKSLERIPTRQRMRVDQTVREIVWLNVAVILGFDFGDGNIRDRLEGIIIHNHQNRSPCLIFSMKSFCKGMIF